MALTVPEAQQGKTGSNVTSLVTGTFATPPSVGDAIVVACWTNAAGVNSTHTAPTDSAGHTATQIGSQQSDTTHNAALTWWVFENLTTGSGLGSYAVTGHWSPASGGTLIAVRVAGNNTPVSYNGDVAQNSLTAETNAANPSVGPTTVTPAANSIFFGAMASANAASAAFSDGTNIAWTHITNETQTDNASFDSLYVEHFIATGGSTTKQTAQWIFGTASFWFALVSSFAPAASGPTAAQEIPALIQAQVSGLMIGRIWN